MYKSLNESLNLFHLQECSVSDPWPLVINIIVVLRVLNTEVKCYHNGRKRTVLRSTVTQMCVRLCVFVLYDASQAAGAHWDLPRRVGSAPLTSLSSLDKDGRNLPLSFSLHPHLLSLSSLYLHLSHSCIIYLPCLFFFFTFLSTWILFYFCPVFFFAVPLLPLTLSLFLPPSCIVSLSSACGLISLVCCSWCYWVTQPACHTWFGGLG